jgi:hypothetical protein
MNVEEVVVDCEYVFPEELAPGDVVRQPSKHMASRGALLVVVSAYLKDKMKQLVMLSHTGKVYHWHFFDKDSEYQFVRFL